MFQHWEKIKVVKSLFLSKFAHLFIFLPKPSSQWKQQFRKNRCIFIWGNKIDKISLKKHISYKL